MKATEVKLTENQLNDILNRFANCRAIVIGDIMVDAYYWGAVDRISPEAPVPIVNVQRRDYRLGGAANVAMNLKGLGAEVTIYSIAGNDPDGAMLIDLLKKENLSTHGILQIEGRPTTVKTRIIAQRNQLLRIDSELTDDLSSEFRKLFLNKIEPELEKADVVIFEDYDKGLLDSTLIGKIVEKCNALSIPVIADPKKRNFHNYVGVTLFKPNLRELAEGLKIDIDTSSPLEKIEEAAQSLIQTMQLQGLLITLSEKGMMHVSPSATVYLPAHVRSIFDVSGAGDTVVSVSALCTVAQTSPEILTALSNLAGGYVCGHAGVVPISAEELRKEALEKIVEA